MKIIWEPQDIVAGRRVGKLDRGERWIIGYNPLMIKDEPRYMLVSLSDGMVNQYYDKQGLCDRLNAAGEMPSELLPPESTQ